MTNWKKHTGTGKPSELADAQIVEIGHLYATGKIFDGTSGIFDRADSAPWSMVMEYRPALDPDGLPYVSAEGLYPWADIVFTDEHGNLWQVSEDPSMRVREMGGFSVDWYQLAPESHRISKARVWRE